MLIVNDRIRIPLEEFTWTYVRAGGPGGQNVNKVSSKAVMRWPVAVSPSLPEETRARFVQRYHTRITTEGELVLSSQRFRDQERNYHDCLDKLAAMILIAANPPAPRRATNPTKGSKTRRLDAKRRTAKTKATRRKPSIDE